jgi:hypothetical protein
MDQPSGSSKGGFDMASMSLASKLTVIGAVLLFIDSFLPWQKACADLSGLNLGSFCVSRNAWGGDGGFAGIIMALLALVLIAFEVAAMMNTNINLSMPMSKLLSYIGFATAVFAIIKFLFSAFNHGTLFAWIGLVLGLVIAYGAWLHFQEPVASTMPPPAPGTDTMS